MFKTLVDLFPPSIETADQRRKFVFSTFVLFGIFVILAVVQWLAFAMASGDRMQKEAKTHEYTAVLLMLMSMFLLMIFSLADQVRNLFCINWIMGLIIVEAEILAVGLLAVHSSLFNILFSLLVLLLVLVFVVIIGFTCQYDFTNNIYVTFTYSYAAFLLSIHAAMFIIIFNLNWYFFIYAAVIFLMAIPVMIYHMQCIFATGQMRTHLQDVLLAALMLFNDFVALFMLTFYWRPDSKNK